MAEILFIGVSCILSEFLEISKTWSAWSTALSSEFCRGKVMLIKAEGYQREDCYLQSPKSIGLHQFWSTTVGYILNGSNSPTVIFHSSFEITLNPCICFSKPTDGKRERDLEMWASYLNIRIKITLTHPYFPRRHRGAHLGPEDVCMAQICWHHGWITFPASNLILWSRKVRLWAGVVR